MFCTLTKFALRMALSDSDTFGTHAERPAVNCRKASLMNSAPTPSNFKNARTSCNC